MARTDIWHGDEENPESKDLDENEKLKKKVDNPEKIADEITDSIMDDNEEEGDFSELTLRFPDDEMKSQFVAWMTDAGGKQDFFQFLKISTLDFEKKDFILKFPWS